MYSEISRRRKGGFLLNEKIKLAFAIIKKKGIICADLIYL